MIQRLYNFCKHRFAKSSSRRFNTWLRQKGCKIGTNVQWHGLKNISVDTTRPSLISIGNDVCFTRGCSLLTHGYDWFVLRNLYDEVVASSGSLNIGNNVFVGINTAILKGVTIGDNCIIGACSVVNKDVPANSVAVGNPVRVVCSIEEYYVRRKKEYIDEAKEYARSIKSRFGRKPVPADFWEEFPLFMDGNAEMQGVPVRRQLGASYNNYSKKHKAHYDNFEEFLRDAGVS